MLENGRERFWDINLVVQEIKEFPQTYNTILGEYKSNGTCQTILRRKLNNLLRQGVIYKTSIPGTRFGQAIFYSMPKKYFILVEAGRTGSTVFCFFAYKQVSRYYIQISPCWKLKNGVWMKEDKKIVFEGNVLKLM